jgi:arabinogalactan endo-1,4-beta-galactosidase
MKTLLNSFLFWAAVGGLAGCKDNALAPGTVPDGEFAFGADLSYVNQILDFGGRYTVSGAEKNPYQIFSEQGAGVVRLRLWHNPLWTKELYGEAGTQLYSDLKDVVLAAERARAHGLQVMLNFHYSDTWADPANQKIPEAWSKIRSLATLRDSVYNYTLKTLNHLKSKSLLPDFVQIGNETNCGLLYTDALPGFPSADGCNGQWHNLRTILIAAIQAVRAVQTETPIKVILHVADPKNVDWWFTNLLGGGEKIDFDIIGFSYYPIWHRTVPVLQLSNNIRAFKSKFGRDVMILETAYPWTVQGNDQYTNIFGDQEPIAGFPYTNQGQLDMMIAMTREVIEGGGVGIIYWEPAWITSNMKDLWGVGSSWENNTFFDFRGEVNEGITFMKHQYK